MTCPRCRASVPDDSAFCLRCGAPLRAGAAAPAAPPPGHPASPTPAPAATAAPAPAEAGARQAYLLSLGPIGDERLRYRVARWVVARAPAHPIGDVQDGLAGGTFATFLALPPGDVEATRQDLVALGVAPGLVRLAPASTAELLRPPRPEGPRAEGRRAMGRREWTMFGAAVLLLMAFGLLVVTLFGGAG